MLACLFFSCKKQSSTGQSSTENISGDTIDSVSTQPIDDSLVLTIKPVINDWLAFYDIDIRNFNKESDGAFDLDSLNDKENIYYTEFDKKDDVYIPQYHDYSPDKTRYINLMSAIVVYLGKDNKYHYSGSDDSQPLTLYDRTRKIAVLFSYRGYSDWIDAVFWIDNDRFVLTGAEGRFLELYDIANKEKQRYVLDGESGKKASYLDKNMESRSIIFDD